MIRKKNCHNLEPSLSCDSYYDIDGLDSFFELKVLREIIQVEDNDVIKILNQIKRLSSFEKKLLKQIDYNIVPNDFTSKIARKVDIK